MKGLATLKKLWEEVERLLDEHKLRTDRGLNRLQKVAHFLVLVGRSFTRNRCPVRASALAYATLLALVPMLAVVMSVTSTFLKDEGEAQIDQFVMRMVASLTPPAVLKTNTVTVQTNSILTIQETETTPEEETDTNVVQVAQSSVGTNQTVLPAFVQAEDALETRQHVARTIHGFIQNTRSGTLGVTGTVALIFVAISMLIRIEDAFNDIWGATQGRTWFMRVVLYWGVISLAPLLIIVALGLATGPHLESTKELLASMPWASKLLFQLLPIVVLSLTFSVFYMAMPNAKVRWDAAVIGGVTSGVLFHLNNLVSVLYVSRVVSNSKIYGGLGLVLVFMIGLYFCWLIVLFGAQVAYAYQNRAAYFEAKQVENINQRGREFIALRLMTVIGQRFVRGEPGPSISHLAGHLNVPGRLITQIMTTLIAARLVVETTGNEPAYVPARPIEAITCHDILMALRSSQGEELDTREEPTRAEVYGEYQRIQEAERKAAASVTMLALVNRAEALGPARALTGVAGAISGPPA